MSVWTSSPCPDRRPTCTQWQVFEQLRGKASEADMNAGLSVKADLAQVTSSPRASHPPRTSRGVLPLTWHLGPPQVEQSLEGKASRSAVAAALQKRARVADMEVELI